MVGDVELSDVIWGGWEGGVLYVVGLGKGGGL